MMSFLIGFLAGMFGGLVGLGGGIVMIPLLVRVFKLEQREAHATSLIALVFTGISGAVTYALAGSVNVAASLFLAAPAVFTAQAGARYAHSLDEGKLKRSFGAFLVVVALLMLFRPLMAPVQTPAAAGWQQHAIFLATGVMAGFLSGMMGVGGGTIMVPVMALLDGFGQHLAQGSSLLAMVPVSGVGAYAHWRLGNIKERLLIGLIPGIFLGTGAGGSLAHVFPDAMLKTVFGAALIGTGISYLRADPGGIRRTSRKRIS